MLLDQIWHSYSDLINEGIMASVDLLCPFSSGDLDIAELVLCSAFSFPFLY